MSEELPIKNIKGSIISNLNNSVALKNYEVVEEADRFLEDKNCAVCNAEFGIIGIVHAKKCMCKFCCRGVCSKCSSERLQHPISKKEERICVVCVQKIMGKHIRMDYCRRVNELEEEKNLRKVELECMVKEKQMDMSYNQYLDEQVKAKTSLYMVKLKALEEGIFEMARGQEGMMKKYIEVKEEYKRFKEDCEKRLKIEEMLKTNLDSLKEVHENNKKVLPDLRNRFGELQETEIRLKAQIREKQEIARSLSFSEKEQKIADKYGELKHMNFILSEENRIFTSEILKLSEEIEDFNEKLLIEEFLSNQKPDCLTISSSSKYSVEEELRISDLKFKSNSNQTKIRDLRMRLESQNISTKKSKINSEYPTPMPGSRPCANCVIY